LGFLNEVDLRFGPRSQLQGREDYEELVRVLERHESLRKIEIRMPTFHRGREFKEMRDKMWHKSLKKFQIDEM